MEPRKSAAFWKRRLKELGISRRRATPSVKVGPCPQDTNRPSNSEKGRAGEEKAASYLEGHGFSVLARNVRYPGLELDLVVSKDALIVFVEVKLRRDLSYGFPAEAVGPGKVSRVRQAAFNWLGENPAFETRDVRFDVVAIEEDRDEIDWIQGAFDAH